MSKILARETFYDYDSGALPREFSKMNLNEEILNASEYINVESDGIIKSREKAYIETGEDEEPVEDFRWMSFF